MTEHQSGTPDAFSEAVNMAPKKINLQGIRFFRRIPVYAPEGIYLLVTDDGEEIIAGLSEEQGGYMVQMIYPRETQEPPKPTMIPAHEWRKRVRAEISYLPPHLMLTTPNIPAGFQNHTGIGRWASCWARI
jgi:hypothetical protein